MGKDLHYSIRPFIERTLTNHMAVREIEKIDLDDFYAYNLKRNFGLPDVIVVLNDDYNFNYKSYLNRPSILNKGGFLLVARPEAHVEERNEVADKIVVCKLRWLMGAINLKEFWTYEPPKNDDD